MNCVIKEDIFYNNRKGIKVLIFIICSFERNLRGSLRDRLFVLGRNECYYRFESFFKDIFKKKNKRYFLIV